MKKIILGALVGVMVFAGAAIAIAQTSEDGSTDASTATTAPVTTDDSVAAPGRGGFGHRGEVLQGVLDGLVADGTLTQEQADAVVAGLEAARGELLAAREELNAAVEEAWSDGVLTEEELNALPEGAARFAGPDGPLAEYWEDGQITQEELDEARANGLGFGRGGRHGHGFGPGGDGPNAPEAENTGLGA
jgi:polyhydroxyalkanoate synthesis regulator phasin